MPGVKPAPGLRRGGRVQAPRGNEARDRCFNTEGMAEAAPRIGAAGRRRRARARAPGAGGGQRRAFAAQANGRKPTNSGGPQGLGPRPGAAWRRRHGVEAPAAARANAARAGRRVSRASSARLEGGAARGRPAELPRAQARLAARGVAAAPRRCAWGATIDRGPSNRDQTARPPRARSGRARAAGAGATTESNAGEQSSYGGRRRAANAEAPALKGSGHAASRAGAPAGGPRISDGTVGSRAIQSAARARGLRAGRARAGGGSHPEYGITSDRVVNHIEITSSAILQAKSQVWVGARARVRTRIAFGCLSLGE